MRSGHAGWVASKALAVWGLLVGTGCPSDVDEVPAGSGSDGATETDTGGTTGTSAADPTPGTQSSESQSSTTETTTGPTTADTTDTTSTTESIVETTGTTTGLDTTGPGPTTSGTTSGETSGSSTGSVECNNANQCDAFDGPCMQGVCVDNVCQAEPLPDETACDTGDLCLENGACDQGTCIGEPVDCSDLDGACVVGVCDPDNGNCEGMPANEGDPCDDQDACTVMDVCGGGTCVGTEGPLFTETFIDDSQGWTLEGKWEIGPAVVSDAGSFSGLTDPAEDHSAGADDGLAGVLIGGLSGPPMHALQYLTSPVIDLSIVDPAADKELRFWRWLVSDSDIMSERIELWDGDSWNQVYQLGNDQYDTDWTQVVIDISGYQNEDFQVRFGHEIISGGPPMSAEPSWSLDDVSVELICN